MRLQVCGHPKRLTDASKRLRTHSLDTVAGWAAGCQVTSTIVASSHSSWGSAERREPLEYGWRKPRVSKLLGVRFFFFFFFLLFNIYARPTRVPFLHIYMFFLFFNMGTGLGIGPDPVRVLVVGDPAGSGPGWATTDVTDPRSVAALPLESRFFI